MSTFLYYHQMLKFVSKVSPEQVHKNIIEICIITTYFSSRKANIMLSVLFCLRYTQPPADLIEWYDGFLDDDEVCHPW